MHFLILHYRLRQALAAGLDWLREHLNVPLSLAGLMLLGGLSLALLSCSGPGPKRLVIPEADQEQYRSWMEEARRKHPYNEPVSRMWKVMVCESAGHAGISNGKFFGLFQYRRDTWKGAWNPYRRKSIFDARAQIFATAKAWQDGHHAWWPACY